MLKNVYRQKAIWYLNAEIELTKLIFSQSGRAPVQNSYNSKVYFVPNSKGLGIDSMGEFALTLDLSKQFMDEEGKPIPFIHIAHTLEDAFNFTFGDAYKSKGRIFIRKPYNLTKALDYLKNLLTRESRNRKMKKDGSINT